MARSKAATARPSIPDTMKAAAIDRFGGPEEITVHRLPVPVPESKEVLIQIHGAGVWDADVRNGSWRPFGRPRFPLVLGTDGAGVIVAKGSQVRKFEVGDQV